MKRKLHVLAFFTALLGIFLVGCGSDTSNGNDSASDTQEITFWGSWSGEQIKQLNELINQYNDQQDKYHVTYKVQDNVEEKLLTAMAGGEVPDVIL